MSRWVDELSGSPGKVSLDGTNWIEARDLELNYDGCAREVARHDHHPEGWGRADELLPSPTEWAREPHLVGRDYIATWYDMSMRRTIMEARVGERVGQIIVTDEEAWDSEQSGDRDDVFLPRQHELVQRLHEANADPLPWQRQQEGSP